VRWCCDASSRWLVHLAHVRSGQPVLCRSQVFDVGLSDRLAHLQRRGLTGLAPCQQPVAWTAGSVNWPAAFPDVGSAKPYPAPDRLPARLVMSSATSSP
jgi:hypothetical protein